MKLKNSLPFYFLRKNFGLCYIFIIFFFTSCVTQRSVEYIQDNSKTIKSFNEALIEDYRLKPNDELYIQINSLDEAATNIFSGTVQQNMYMGSMQPFGASLISYTIDKSGYLHLPFIGSIMVKDKTLIQVGELIKVSLTNVLSQPLVTVKLVNRFVSVLGEVRNPGYFNFTQDKFTIYNAIGLAGDITDYGNRKDVIITRNQDGKNIRINVDLTDSEILSSSYYYLQPNDIIYIKPLRKKFWNLRQFPYSVVLSTITTSLLIYNVIK